MPLHPTNSFSLSLAIWLQWWTKANEKHPNERIGYWVGVYFGLAALAVIGCMASDWYVVDCKNEIRESQANRSLGLSG